MIVKRGVADWLSQGAWLTVCYKGAWSMGGMPSGTRLCTIIL